MGWWYLVVAGVLEVGWAVGLRYSEGLTRLVPSLVTALALMGSVWLLALATRTVPLGTAYAIWVGIGAAGTAVAGAVLFGEAMPPLRVACLGLLIVALVGLKLTSP